LFFGSGLETMVCDDEAITRGPRLPVLVGEKIVEQPEQMACAPPVKLYKPFSLRGTLGRHWATQSVLGFRVGR